jgi:hypothetical protein
VEQADQFYISFAYLRPYHPYLGGRNPSFRRATDGLLLDLKDGKQHGIDAAAAALNDLVTQTPALLAMVPGHEARKTNVGRPLERVIAQVAAAHQDRYIAAPDLFTRITTIDKRALGGADRGEDEHVRSIRTDDAFGLLAAPLIILDDVATTGNSIAACRKLAAAFGYDPIAALVIGRTTYD